jgi:hypothetical protein
VLFLHLPRDTKGKSLIICHVAGNSVGIPEVYLLNANLQSHRHINLPGGAACKERIKQGEGHSIQHGLPLTIKNAVQTLDKREVMFF